MRECAACGAIAEAAGGTNVGVVDDEGTSDERTKLKADISSLDNRASDGADDTLVGAREADDECERAATDDTLVGANVDETAAEDKYVDACEEGVNE